MLQQENSIATTGIQYCYNRNTILLQQKNNIATTENRIYGS